jgi:guanosine-3',5'-bis(diphosphate) 3'-pyrophosphohydrolase
VGHDENQGEVEARRAVIGLPPGASTRRAQCCQAVPGERIVGITYPGKGPIVHAIDCEALAAFDDSPTAGSTCTGRTGATPRSTT